MKLDKYVKIEEWFDSSLGQSTVIQRLDLKEPTLSKQTQNKRKYVNFENGSHFICSFNLNNPETTVCIVFKMTNIASGDQLFVSSLIGNSDQKVNSKFITFYKTYSGLGLLISKAQSGSYVAIANDDSSSIKPDLKFPSSKSNCTILNEWHIISVTWSKGENLSNCWSDGVKLTTFTMGNVKGTDHCYIGNYLIIPRSQFSSIGLFHFLSVQGDGRKKFKSIFALDFFDKNILPPGKQLGEFSVSLEFHSELPSIFASFVLSKCQWM